MDKKKVCHISTVHNLYDDRVFYKECVSLAESGYSVFFVVTNDKACNIKGVEIVPMPCFKSRSGRILKGGFIALKKALSTKSVICHFHDPELLWVGVLLRIFGRKVIYDVHENYTQQILYKEWISFRFIRKLVSVSFFVFEKISCLFFNSIITVTEDIQSRFSRSKTFLVRNFPVIPENIVFEKIPRNDGKTILIYAGGLTRIRGIKELIESLQFLDDSVVLWLVGSFDDEDYKNECSSIPSWNKVVYHGYVRHEEVYKYISSSDIGISLLYPVRNYLTSLPVKVFEYMLFEKPVIMSDFRYWMTYFNECAVFSDPQNPVKIAGCIAELISDKQKMRKMGKRGAEMIFSKYSWNIEKLEMDRIYKLLLGK